MPEPIKCLENLVSVDGRCEAGISIFKILDLPGFDKELVESASNKDKSGLEVITDIIKLAQHEIKSRIITDIQPRFRAATLIDHDTMGEYRETEPDVDPEAGFYRGIYMRLHRRSYMSFLLNSLRLFFKGSDVSDTIVIIDLKEGRIIDQISFEALDGQILTVEPNSLFRSFANKSQWLDLFIGIDGGLETMAGTTLHLGQGIHGCCGHSCFRFTNHYATFQSQKIPIVGPLNIRDLINIEDTGGLTFDYGISCDIEGLMCNLGDLLAYPLYYLAGSMSVDAVRKSRNFDDATTIHSDTLEDMQAEFFEKFEVKLETLLTSMGKGITDNVCFECREAVRSVSAIP